MIRTLTIENFRCFEQFELHDLGRVNLLVGGNNSGKTTILEAVELLTADGDVSALARIQLRRSEELEDDRDIRTSRKRFLDVCRLFNGHSAELGQSFSVTAVDKIGRKHAVTAEVLEVEGRSDATDGLFSELDEPLDWNPYRALGLNWEPGDGGIMAHLGPNGALPLDSLRYSTSARGERVRPANVRFVSASSLTPDEAIEHFGLVQLRPQEQFVYDSLRIIEPNIQRLGIQIERIKTRGFSGIRGGFSVLLSTYAEPVPIGSMGEGIWRLLCLALCLARAEKGILLIDEIDTGLHYSVMEKMWKLVTETAKRLNIQVFATSHSRDCVESLAAVCHEDVTANSEITIQRIERGKSRSVAFSEREIVIAANRGIEVR